VSQARNRFLIDLNVGAAVANALRQTGHDVLYVGDDNPRVSDIDMLRLAVREQRIIITQDTDFGELVHRSGESHTGVLLLRMPGAGVAEKVRVVEEIVDRYGSQLPHRFSVFRNGRLRIRE
jgi:predicted nuclease of predicted toxin-antitoxin system